jgi:hypothetical protein
MGIGDRGVEILTTGTLDRISGVGPESVAFSQQAEWGAVLFVARERRGTAHSLVVLYAHADAGWTHVVEFGNPWFDANWQSRACQPGG